MVPKMALGGFNLVELVRFRGWTRLGCRTTLGVFASLWAMSSGGYSAAEERLEYNRDIRPILAENCFACHGPDSAARKANLRLDLRDKAIKVGAITPYAPSESELVARILSEDPEFVMPPPETKKQLSEGQKRKLNQWIEAGAKYQSHWSLIVPERPPLPSVRQAGWAKNPIDLFVLARLESHGLSPAPQADPTTLSRRLSLDITGLPPLPGDVAAFVADYSERPDIALSNWVDRLMKTSRWGEHRARYWLDAARYADTHGLHFDNYREMWPYRDWVIRGFNDNLPFDRFTVDQIAGDLLPSPTVDQLIATGFQRCNITTNEGGTIDEENLALYASDRVQTLGWVYLGLTTNCGQCHDHKFDPFTTEDYYALAAFFRNTTQKAKDGNVKDGRGPVLVVPLAEDQDRWEALPKQIAAANADRNRRRQDAKADFQRWLEGVQPDLLDAKVATAGLIAHLPLDHGGGEEGAILLPESQKLKATGEVAWIAEGKLGPAPVMKPGTTYELGAVGDFEKDQKFSYGAWIRIARKAGQGGIIARMDEKNSFRGWDLWQNGQTVAAHFIDSWPDNGIKVRTKKNVLKPGTWQHVFVTYDGSARPKGIRIYVDGERQQLNVDTNTLKPDATIRTTTPLRVGQRSHSQVFDGGAIQDVRVYDRTLSSPEVKAVKDIVPLRAILATAPERRTSQQQATLFEHYLMEHDSAYPVLTKRVADLEAERQAIESRSPVTHVQQERMDSPPFAHILMRGEYDKRGRKVAASTPAALHPMPEDAPKNRLGLARWLVDSRNPLTARVTVNRFWLQVFGQGIVATAEDFGVMGAEPSHPELLDWLAVEFRESGWDVKRFFKLIFTSATYRQAAITTAEKLQKDRDNVLLSRGPRFRMDAEMVRDYALAASGLLCPEMYGPGTKPYQPEGIWDIVGLPGGNTRNYVQDKGDRLYRRTIYHFWKRMAPPPSLEAFNAPSREFCSVRRERTNTPLQALVTLNDPQFVEAARFLAQTALSDSPSDDRKVLNYIAQRILCRPLKANEEKLVFDTKSDLHEYYESNPSSAEALIEVGESKVTAEIDPVKLAAWTMVCNQLLNLDEVLNK